MGYYETIAGGAGAGLTWHGCSGGVHTHMTNTRIADRRNFGKTIDIRSSSDGSVRLAQRGPAVRCQRLPRWGGDGVVQELEFRQELTVSILSECWAFQPYGMAGGLPAQRRFNHLVLQEGEEDAKVTRTV